MRHRMRVTRSDAGIFSMVSHFSMVTQSNVLQSVCYRLTATSESLTQIEGF